MLKSKIYLLASAFLLSLPVAFCQESDRPVIYPFGEFTRKPYKVEDSGGFKSALAMDKKRSEYSREDWQALIDSRWGDGLPVDQKLEIFDAYWNRVDQKFGSFPNLNVEWEGLKQKYRPEIEEGVSRGRLAAILSLMNVALLDAHLIVYDTSVIFDVLEPGIPLMVFYPNGGDNRFGASLTPLEDSTLLVYQVAEGHPLGLEPGDRILGYEGKLWKTLYRELLSYELPVTNNNAASTPESATHIWLSAAGENWHLFDTIDILPYNSSDTLHLATSLLANQGPLFPATEQLAVPGVSFPDFQNGESISWGIIDSTNIGYIYTYLWSYGSSAFENAIKQLMYNHQTEGLIIDTRFDWGGWPGPAKKGLRHLFNRDGFGIVDVIRNDPGNHYGLELLVIDDDEAHFDMKVTSDIYDKPIAVLTGPNSISMGDYFPLMLSSHPYVRTFGKPTNGAYSGFWESWNDSLLVHGWQIGYPDITSYQMDQPGQYLVHTATEVDEKIWLEADAVARGEDNVVSRAVDWIQNRVHPYNAMVPAYVAPGSMLPVEVAMKNPNQHALKVQSYLKRANSNHVIRQQDLEPDYSSPGALGMFNTDSTLYTGLLRLPDGEDDYSLHIQSIDLEDGEFQELPIHFTSRGPVEVDHIEVISGDIDFREGGSMSVNAFLVNSGSLKEVRNIKIGLSSIDSCLVPMVPSLRYSFGDFGAGEIKERALLAFLLKPGCTMLDSLPMQVDVYEGDILRWTDTLYITKNSMLTHTNPGATSKNDHGTVQLRNYPNPFIFNTIIEFKLIEAEIVMLKVYNALGQELAVIASGELSGGVHQFKWQAKGLPAGIYYLRFQAGDFVETSKMIYGIPDSF